MTPNDKLPEKMQERIKADSISAYLIPVKFSDQVACMNRREGYIAGATAWAGWKLRFDELQAQAKAMADALEKHKEAYDYLAKEAERKYTEAYENDTKPVAATLMFNMLHKSYIKASRRTSEALQQFKDGKDGKNEAEFEGSSITSPAPGVAIGCISPEARELLDTIMNEWDKHFKNLKEAHGCEYDPGLYGFAYWLVRWSGLIQPANTNPKQNS